MLRWFQNTLCFCHWCCLYQTETEGKHLLSRSPVRYSLENLPRDLVSKLIARDSLNVLIPPGAVEDPQGNGTSLLADGYDRGMRKGVSYLRLHGDRFEQVSHFFRSADIMSRLYEAKIDSVLKVYNVVCDSFSRSQPPVYAIVTEKIQRNLQYFIHEHQHPALLLSWAMDLAKGLASIHEQGIIHGSLSVPNLWVTPPLHALDLPRLKIGGFERACQGVAVRQAYPATSFLNPRPLDSPVAPESVDHNMQLRESDIFSFGIVLWEMFSAKNAWQTIAVNSPEEYAAHVEQYQAAVQKYEERVEKYRIAVKRGELDKLLPLPAAAPPEIAALIKGCWNTKLYLRPKIENIISTIAAAQPRFRSLYVFQKAIGSSEA